MSLRIRKTRQPRPEPTANMSSAFIQPPASKRVFSHVLRSIRSSPKRVSCSSTASVEARHASGDTDGYAGSISDPRSAYASPPRPDLRNSFPPSAASSIRRPSVDRASSTASATADGPPMPMLPAVRLCMHAESERLNETGDTQFWVAVEAEVVAGTSSTANNRRSLLGEVHNLYFTFTTYAACSIETRLDENHNASSLDVGETVSVLVSIKVDASAAASACTTDSDDSKQHQPYLDDAFSQIESLLGVTVVPVLSVECHYKQSSFPPDNEIVVRDTLYMHHQRSRSTPSRFSPSAMASRKEVHQRLAYFIVSTNPSDQALVELDRVFAPPIRACACPAYLEALKQELWRRLDTDRRRSLITSHESSMYHFSRNKQSPSISNLSSNPRTCQENEPPTQCCLSSNPSLSSQTSFSRDNLHPEPLKTPKSKRTDPACKIWRHIRATSRSSQDQVPAVESFRHEAVLFDRLTTIRQQAVANKRSMGADTLRSLALDMAGGDEKRENAARARV